MRARGKGWQNPRDMNFEKTLLVVGNESNGIAPEWLRDCQEFLTIPMPGNAESLNAAVAGSIAMYLAFGKN